MFPTGSGRVRKENVQIELSRHNAPFWETLASLVPAPTAVDGDDDGGEGRRSRRPRSSVAQSARFNGFRIRALYAAAAARSDATLSRTGGHDIIRVRLSLSSLLYHGRHSTVI